MSELLFAVWGVIIALNLIHAMVFSKGYFEANRRLLRLKFNKPEASPRLARVYATANGLVAIVTFPLYWVLALSCHRRYNGDWLKWADSESSRNE